MEKLKQQLKGGGLQLEGRVKWIKSKGGVLLAESPWMPNKIAANSEHGIYILLDLLAGDDTYSGEVTHADIGDDNTTPTEADTDLGNGLVRAQIGNISRSGLETDFRFFFADANTPDDTYEEFGMFIDGSAGVGTGQIFNHLVFTSSLVKASGEDYTIVCKITAWVT